jgi:hypothetical protein
MNENDITVTLTESQHELLKEHFITEWLYDNPDDSMTDAIDAWRNHIDYVNQFNDWDNQINWEDD